ncbi:MAG: ArsR family transcriptional regulator [Candidatus Heimdallarchaeota archaeon]|nr:ArsR family transcriptional regulator [Candidatus Heimdallarchaeota archaeon]
MTKISSSSLTPDIIREKIKEIAEKIEQETSWSLERELSDIKIELGKAPEYYESFGVHRQTNKLIFGEWLNRIEPKTVRKRFWEFILVREALTLFFEKKFFGKELRQLTNFILNIGTFAFLKKKYPKTLESKFNVIRGRFLLIDEETKKEHYLLLNLRSLIDKIVNQGISYQTLLDTFKKFIDEDIISQINIEELVNDLSLVFSNNPLEIAAPIYLPKRTADILEKLVELGFKTSTTEIAESLEINQSTVSRHIAKLSSRYTAKWIIERNWAKLGLETHLLLIRLPLGKANRLASLIEELLNYRYIYNIFEGRGKDYLYIYTVIHSPNLLIKIISKKLSLYQKKGYVSSFLFKRVFNRLYYMGITSNYFRSTISDLIKIINDEISVTRINLWDNNWHQDEHFAQLDSKDKPLLRFLSIIQSDSLTSYGNYGCFLPELKRFLEDHNLNINSLSEALSFINNLQKRALDRELVNYRLTLAISRPFSQVFLVIRIMNVQTADSKNNIINKFSKFNVIFLQLEKEIILIIIGLSFDHKMSSILVELVREMGYKTEFFSIKYRINRFVPYHQLYDYQSGKWFIN